MRMNKRQPVGGLQTQLEELQSQLAALKGIVLAQQAELTTLRETRTSETPLSPAPTVSAEPIRTRKPDTTRRKMLKRLGLAVLAGGATLGVTATTYTPAEARISVNQTTNIGAIITRNGTTVSNLPSNANYGLIATSEVTLNGNTLTFFGDSGVYGNSTSGSGVQGSTNSGYGVVGLSKTGTGVAGFGSNGIGIYGQSQSATIAAISAHNSEITNGPNGIALQIDQGGLTVSNAGINSDTAAFIHRTTSGNITADISFIDNPLCNNRPDALLFVTHNCSPANPPVGGSPVREAKPFGVLYNPSSNKWNIIMEDSTGMPVNAYFNVLIINP